MADMFNALMQGRQAGQQNRLAQLASQSYGAPQESQQSLLSQMAAIDPRAAQAQQGQFQQDEDRTGQQLRGYVEYVNKARATNNPMAVNAALRAGAPLIQRLTGKAPPTEWTPDMDAGWAELEAKVAMQNPTNASAAPTGFREIDMKLQAAGYQPGTPEYQEGMRIATGQQGRAATGGFGFEMIRGADGIERPGRQNPRTGTMEVYDEGSGQFIPIGGGGALNGGAPAPAPASGGLVATPQGGQAYIEPGLSPEQMAAAQADIAAGGSSDNYQLPPQNMTPRQFNAGAGRPAALAVGRSPEQQAALTAQATQNVELGGLPVRQQIENQGAIDRAVGLNRVESAAETVSAAPGAIATVQQSIDSIDALLNDPDLESIVGLGSVNPLNLVPGSKGRGLIARADQIAGQAFLAAFNQLKGGGAITEKEGEAATKAMARLDRSQNINDYKQALQDLKAAIMPALERQRVTLARAQQTVGGGGEAAAPIQRARNPQTGEVLELRNGQWVPAR